jgi:hypothetical protein
MTISSLRSVVVFAACLAGGLFSGLCPVIRGEDKKKASSLTIVNEKGKTTAFTTEALAKLPRERMTVTDRSGRTAMYEGVALAALLRAAEVTLGKDLKGPLLANCLVVEAADKYKVLFSLPEIDPDLTDRVVLLADRKDGKALDSKEGEYRLIVPHDKRPSRWVRQVTRISVQSPREIRQDKRPASDQP